MSQSDTLTSALNDFKRSVEITRDVRFQANLRLASRQRLSAYMVSILSLYVIGLSTIPNIIVLENYQEPILLACSIILSVFVIFTSLIDASQNFYHQGELLHQCARKVATVYHELKNIDPLGDVAAAKIRLEELQENYRKALDECPINHDNVDFLREQAHKPALFPNNYRWKWRTPERLFKKTIGLFLTYSWMLIHLLAILAVTLIVYFFVLRNSVGVQG